MNFQPLILRKTVDDFTGGMQIGKAVLRLHQLRIAIMSDVLGKLCSIVMSGDKIHRNGIVMTILHKGFYPNLITASANRRTTYAEAAVHRLHGTKGIVEQSEILLHIRMFPEAWQIRLIPDLNGPGHHLIPAVPVTQV